MGKNNNKALWYAVAFGFCATIPTAFIPGINVYMFEQLNFSAIWWVILLGEIIIFIGIAELYKFIKRSVLPAPASVQPRENENTVVVVVE